MPVHPLIEGPPRRDGEVPQAEGGTRVEGLVCDRCRYDAAKACQGPVDPGGALLVVTLTDQDERTRHAVASTGCAISGSARALSRAERRPFSGRAMTVVVSSARLASSVTSRTANGRTLVATDPWAVTRRPRGQQTDGHLVGPDLECGDQVRQGALGPGASGPVRAEKR